MIKKYVLLAALAFISIPAIAQDRPRFFDNFDTSKGVQVYRAQEFVPVGAKNKATAVNTRIAPDKKLVRKTAQAHMSVGDSLALRELVRPDFKKVSMAVGKSMRGFTTGDGVIDSYIVDSSLRY